MEQEIPVRFTFVMLLAIADPTGLVVGTDVAIARRLNMPLNQFLKCVNSLQQPDPDSNSKEEEGRRIAPSVGERGYRIINYVRYRNLKDEDDRRDYMRDYMRKRRCVNSGKPELAQLTQAEAEAEAEAEGGASAKPPPRPRKQFEKPGPEALKLEAAKIGLPESECQKFLAHYESNGWRVGRNPMVSWRHALINWKVGYEERRSTHGNNKNPKPNPRNEAMGPPHPQNDYVAAFHRKAIGGKNDPKA